MSALTVHMPCEKPGYTFNVGFCTSLDDMCAAAPLAVKLLRHGTLKVYQGFPHGMPTTNADVINADLLAFIKA